MVARNPKEVAKSCPLSTRVLAGALKSDGTVATWGACLYPPTGLSNVVAIAAGNGHSLALKEDGTVVGWQSVSCRKSQRRRRIFMV